MPTTSELELPDPLAMNASTSSDFVRLDSPECSGVANDASQSDQAARSTASEYLSPRSDDGIEVESSFSSLLMSVAGRDASRQISKVERSHPSVGSLERIEQDADTRSDADDAFSMVSGPSPSITGIPSTGRPRSIEAVLDQVVQAPANDERLKTWVEQGVFWDGRAMKESAIETPMDHDLPAHGPDPSLACPTVSSIYPLTSANSSVIHIDTDDANLSLSISASEFMGHSQHAMPVSTPDKQPPLSEDGPVSTENSRQNTTPQKVLSPDNMQVARPAAGKIESKTYKWQMMAPHALQIIAMLLLCFGNIPRVADPTFSEFTAGRATPDPADLIIVSSPKASNISEAVTIASITTPQLALQSPSVIISATTEISSSFGYILFLGGAVLLRWIYKRLITPKEPVNTIVRPGSKRRIHIRPSSSPSRGVAKSAFVKQAVEASVKPFPGSSSADLPGTTISPKVTESIPTKSILKRSPSPASSPDDQGLGGSLPSPAVVIPKQTRFDAPTSTPPSVRVLRSMTNAGRQQSASPSSSKTSASPSPLAKSVRSQQVKITKTRRQISEVQEGKKREEPPAAAAPGAGVRQGQAETKEQGKRETTGDSPVWEEKRSKDRQPSCKYESSHVVYVHGAPDVGKSSIILCARQMDLPLVKQDAGIRSHCLQKGDYGVNFVYRDTGVSDEAWNEWLSKPANTQITTGTISGRFGKIIRLFVYSAVDDDSRVQAYLEASSYLKQSDEDSFIVMLHNKTDLLDESHECLAAMAPLVSSAFFTQQDIPQNAVSSRVRSFAVSADNADGVSEALRDLARELRHDLSLEVAAKTA